MEDNTRTEPLICNLRPATDTKWREHAEQEVQECGFYMIAKNRGEDGRVLRQDEEQEEQESQREKSES